MKTISKVLLSRIFVVAVAVIAQVAWVVMLVAILSNNSRIVSGIVTFFSLLIVLWIVNKRINPAYKLAWTMLILVIPVFGIVVYFLFGKSRVARQMEHRFEEMKTSEAQFLQESRDVSLQLERDDPEAANQSRYIRDYAGYPLYANTFTKYYSVGDDVFEDLIEMLRSAKKYIFIEMFIIGEGYMWTSILDILKEKAEQGVDVRLIYDDLGCAGRIPHHYYRELQENGIKCACFNPLLPMVNIILNNRDHRKIIVADGHTAITGGINFADEYINQQERFGHWKDAGVMCKGPAVWNFTAMFLQMWSVVTKTPSETKRFATPVHSFVPPEACNGYVQPYGDMPLDNETVGENVYLNIINRARSYVYIFTPYLIVDNEMMTALCLAAKSGVDIRIVTPEIPDKKLVYLLTQSYYEQLLEAGVRIYQYTPGFIHSKCVVCDDEIATVGTINLDYRSLYLHFECGTWMYKTDAVLEVKRDAMRTFAASEEIELSFCKNRNIVIRGFQSILRLFAPML